MIRDTFAQMDEDIFGDIHDVPMLEKAKQPLYEGSRTKYSLFYIIVSELKGFEWFIKHLFDIDPKVCNMVHHIYIKVDLFPLFLVLINV